MRTTKQLANDFKNFCFQTGKDETEETLWNWLMFQEDLEELASYEKVELSGKILKGA